MTIHFIKDNDDEIEGNHRLFKEVINKITHLEKRVDLQDESIKLLIKRLDLIYEVLDCDRILLNLKLQKIKEEINLSNLNNFKK